ncbi:hypothetical protein C5167_037021 [Papaver somniferum]|uniref:Uncharacterized protein n=1 Tax=Papaver somniferum TaxID=3469 RepID=A0A4Y7I8P1_PAPSO|nr:hypothetical protein C5167_037021 [Papaver somniferum]
MIKWACHNTYTVQLDDFAGDTYTSVIANNITHFHPRTKIILDPGKLLVPEYAVTFVRETSKKPFGRLWCDDIVSTIVGRAEIHNQTFVDKFRYNTKEGIISSIKN